MGLISVSQRIFHVLASIDEVEKIVSRYIELKPLGVEEIDLLDSLGRVLAEDIYSPIDHPSFDRSLVDGYAVRSRDIAGADDLHPVELRVKGSVPVGVHPEVEVGEREAVEIATGAMIPRGADSIVMVEYTKRISDKVVVYKSTYPGENITTSGSDISRGDLVLLKGTLLSEKEIGLLAGLGYRRIKVYRRPRIAVYSTGNEVIEPGEELTPGKVYDVNGYLVTTMLKNIGTDAEFKGLLPDDHDTIYEKLSKDLEKYDVLITSGGTSAGLGDLIYRVFDELGEPGVVIHGLKIKPGKPTVFAVAEKKLLIGLPGFPLSCYMVAHKIVKPLIMKLTGYKPKRSWRVKAHIPVQLRKPLGKTWFIPVALVETTRGYTAYPVSTKSGSISPLVYADGFIALPENTDLVLADTLIEVELFRDIAEIPRLNIIGSNDYLLYRIVSHLGLQYDTRIISTGSTGGWLAVKRGEADIAPTHLYDPVSDEYNIPFLDKHGLRGKAVIIRGYERRIGILVKPGNPKNIKSIRDFLRKDIVIVNRTKGSGIRVFLDYVLRRIAEEKNVPFDKLVEMINGYTYEVKTHTAVAAAIAQGRADAGIAAEIAAKMYGLDFIPLKWEKYDFLVLKERLKKEYVAKFIEGLKSIGVKNLIESTPGYRLPSDYGEIIE